MIGIFDLHRILVAFWVVSWTHMLFQFAAALRQELYKYKTDQKDK